jgi:hypothetical protein
LVPGWLSPSFEPDGLSGLEYPQYTTPLSNQVSEFVTIVHPCHPLNGQQVEVIRVRRGTEPDLIVRLPDGRHAAVAESMTNYAGSTENEQLEERLHLLDLDGLRQIVAFMDAMQGKGCPTESSRGVSYD